MELNEVIENASLFSKMRKPKSAEDFGDDKTIGLKLKRRGKPFMDLGDYDFGFFLGEYRDQWHVGAHMIMSFNPDRLDSYDSLEDLKENWILD